MNEVAPIAKFVLLNFGPILAFYVGNHLYGLKAGVTLSVVWVVGEVIYSRVKAKPLTLFFKFSAGLTIIFGIVDLYLQKSVLFRYEPSISNLFVGIFFGLTLLGDKPIILEFAQARGNIKGEITPDRLYYFKCLTVVWTGYMFVKAAFYWWVAMSYTLEEAIVIRASVGTISFYILLAVSIFGAPYIKLMLAKLKMLPSSRTEKKIRSE